MTTPIIAVDFETRSDIELKTRGVYEYFDSEHTEVYLACVLDPRTGEAQTWWLGDPVPTLVVETVAANGYILAHNAEFEWLAWTKVLTPRCGWPVVRLEQFVCSAALARATGLPGSLDHAAQCLELTERKIDTGYRLMLKMCKPIDWEQQ